MREHVRDERGAIAIMAMLLMVGMVVMAAFVVDFGLAYQNKRQAQTAADAGTLAAADVYRGQTGTCASLASDTALKTTATAAANKLRDANLDGVDTSLSTLSVTCNSRFEIVINYSVGKNSAVGVGQLVFNSDHVVVARDAQATLDIHPGMRPWSICSDVVTTSGNVVFVPTKGGSVANASVPLPCGPDGPPGGWWVDQCTGQGNGTGDTKAAVLNGCPTSGYHAVPGQLSSMTPTTLRNYLVSVCPTKTTNDTCLSSDPGNNFGLSNPEWQTVVGHIITMPVVCFPPECAPSAAIDGGGNNASYAIKQIATVEVCGFNMNSVQSTGWPTTGACKDNNPLNYTPASVTSGEGLFVVIRSLQGGSSPWVGTPAPPVLQLTK